MSWGFIWQEIAPAWGWVSRLILLNPMWSEALHRLRMRCIWPCWQFSGICLPWPSLPWNFLFVRLHAFVHCWAPSVWFGLTCVINPVEDHLLASASWILNVFVITFFVGSFHFQSVCLLMEWVARVPMDFLKGHREDAFDCDSSSRKMSWMKS